MFVVLGFFNIRYGNSIHIQYKLSAQRNVVLQPSMFRFAAPHPLRVAR